MIDIQLHKALSGPSGDFKLDIDLTIKSGEIITLYGPSGSGKTSILRMIAGLLEPDNGRIEVGQNVWFDHSSKINLKPQKRDVGLVFQEFALFPNMTILENLNFALSKGQDKRMINDIVEMMALEELKNRRPHTLSGGQKQRVALARALVRKPQLLLLDEPLSALDQEMRSRLQEYILEVHKTFKLTTVLVSHDISEVFRMSDQLVVLDNGKIAKKGRPAEVFSNKEVSGKFQFAGEILTMEQQGFIWIISILIGSDIVRVVAENTEGQEFRVGDKVLVASKAFNPIIKKIS